MKIAIIVISSMQIVLAAAAVVTRKQTGSYPVWFPFSLMATCIALLTVLAAEQWL
ncbi:hypothetical protein AB0O91_38135 [Kitasatospora sp. NPDC089797]|uniref:hypothetical protein n=1 Tax=Kitasatospora sp. NPDC089797 TaxID=3155298 RepID=UPI003431DAEF